MRRAGRFPCDKTAFKCWRNVISPQQKCFLEERYLVTLQRLSNKCAFTALLTNLLKRISVLFILTNFYTDFIVLHLAIVFGDKWIERKPCNYHGCLLKVTEAAILYWLNLGVRPTGANGAYFWIGLCCKMYMLLNKNISTLQSRKRVPRWTASMSFTCSFYFNSSSYW